MTSLAATSPVTDPTTHTFAAEDGLILAYHEVGSGRPVVLLHGYISAALETWMRSGSATGLQAAGRRLIMPDMRGHGDSAKPHDPSAYPPDALTSDARALIAHLGLTDYDLAGYSLGARVAARLMALGARPGRAVLGGTGLDPIVHAVGRGDSYRRLFAGLGAFAPGTPEGQMQDYMTSIGADPIALSCVLDTIVDTPREALATVDVPTLVIAGEDDTARGSVEELAAVLPRGRLRRVPGDHVTALLGPQFRDDIAAFLTGPGAWTAPLR
jgi:pimeloyl-ACP methyl ester carboxylesterase